MTMAGKTKGEIETSLLILQDLFKSRQYLDFSEKDLGLKVGMAEKTVRKHLNKLKVDTGSRTIDAITKTFLDDFDMIMGAVKKGIRKALKDKDEKRVLYLTTQLSKNWVIFANLLESFGLKAKAVENINLKAEITQKQFILNYNVSSEIKK